MIAHFLQRSSFRILALLTPVLFCAVQVDAFELKNPVKTKTLVDLLYLVLNSLVFILFPFIVLLVVYAGYLFVAAQGNPTKLQDARRATIWAIVGAIILLGAKAIAYMLSATIQPFLN